MDTPILKGVQIYHNFIKPHEGLKGGTPAEAAGIKLDRKEKKEMNRFILVMQDKRKYVQVSPRNTELCCVARSELIVP
jgi:hypothetical protein